MRLHHPTPHRARQTISEHGNILMVVMGLIVVIGIALSSVIGLVMQEHRILARTTAWNAALPVAEAGIEEALSHLCQVNLASRATNGWTASGTAVVMTNSSALNAAQYVVGISSGADPVVLAYGYAWCVSANRYIERRVEVQTTWQPDWDGLVAKTKAEVGGSAQADSYNSRDPLYSTAGKYDPAKYRDKTMVAAISGDTYVKDSAKVYGDVGTDVGFFFITPPAKVGDKTFVNGAGSGLQTGHSTTDLTQSFPAVAAPTSPSPWITTIPASQILSNANYKIASYTLAGTLSVKGNVILYCTSEFHPTSGSVVIDPGAKLTLYYGSQFYAENGIQINVNGTPEQLSVLGVGAGATEVYLQGTGTKMTGTFYTPAAKMYIQDNAELSGAGVCNDLVVQGTAKFHYDENLDTTGRPYKIVSWAEL